jgi:hypothetical protein
MIIRPIYQVGDILTHLRRKELMQDIDHKLLDNTSVGLLMRIDGIIGRIIRWWRNI